MSYETAIKWALDHVPPQDEISFNFWYNKVSSKMNTPSLMDNPTFNRMLENAWIDATGTDSEDNPVIIERTPSREREIQMPSRRELPTLPKRGLLYNQIITSDMAPVEVQSNAPIVITQYYSPDEKRTLPPTGSSPTIPRPILKFPSTSILTKITDVFNILRKIRI